MSCIDEPIPLTALPPVQFDNADELAAVMRRHDYRQIAHLVAGRIRKEIEQGDDARKSAPRQS
ncbi:MAG: hypothetical protein RIC89_03965 [Pseudomonadales bacterium]